MSFRFAIKQETGVIWKIRISYDLKKVTFKDHESKHVCKN